MFFLLIATLAYQTIEVTSADTVFKCTDANGHILFSDQPCKADTVEILSMPDAPVTTPGYYPPLSGDSRLQSFDDRESDSVDSYGYAPPQYCEIDVSSWEQHVDQYKIKLKNCGKKHSGKSIESMERSLKVGRNRDMKNHSDTAKELHRKSMNELGCRVSWRQKHKKHGKKYFRGDRCIEDCGGHAAGYDWAREKEIVDCNNCYGTPPSASFTEGCMAYVSDK